MNVVTEAHFQEILAMGHCSIHKWHWFKFVSIYLLNFSKKAGGANLQYNSESENCMMLTPGFLSYPIKFSATNNFLVTNEVLAIFWYRPFSRDVTFFSKRGRRHVGVPLFLQRPPFLAMFRMIWIIPRLLQIRKWSFCCQNMRRGWRIMLRSDIWKKLHLLE